MNRCSRVGEILDPFLQDVVDEVVRDPKETGPFFVVGGGESRSPFQQDIYIAVHDSRDQGMTACADCILWCEDRVDSTGGKDAEIANGENQLQGFSHDTRISRERERERDGGMGGVSYPSARSKRVQSSSKTL